MMLSMTLHVYNMYSYFIYNIYDIVWIYIYLYTHAHAHVRSHTQNTTQHNKTACLVSISLSDVCSSLPWPPLLSVPKWALSLLPLSLYIYQPLQLCSSCALYHTFSCFSIYWNLSTLQCPRSDEVRFLSPMKISITFQVRPLWVQASPFQLDHKQHESLDLFLLS